MSTAKLLEAAQAATESQISLLIEGGAYKEDVFAHLHEQNTIRMHSLYQHPQLQEVKMVGPWLLTIENPATLADELNSFPLAIGAIFHSAPARVLATQLSWACTPLTPENKPVLSRFYIREVLEALTQCAEAEWHRFLFSGIQQWWTPEKHGWSSIIIPPSTAQNALDHAIRIDAKTWMQINDRPDISGLLAQWQKLPSAQAFPRCSQRAMAAKALDKACAAGMDAPTDRTLYALVYLDGGKLLLESEDIQAALGDVIQGKRKLADVLLAAG